MNRLLVMLLGLAVVLSCSTAWAGWTYVSPAPVVVYRPFYRPVAPVVTYYPPVVPAPVVVQSPVVTPAPVVVQSPVVTPTPVVTPEAVVYPGTVVYPGPAVIRARAFYGPRRAVYRVVVP